AKQCKLQAISRPGDLPEANESVACLLMQPGKHSEQHQRDSAVHRQNTCHSGVHGRSVDRLRQKKQAPLRGARRELSDGSGRLAIVPIFYLQATENFSAALRLVTNLEVTLLLSDLKCFVFVELDAAFFAPVVS